MRRCPTCKTTYQDSFEFCIRDGVALVAVAPSAPTGIPVGWATAVAVLTVGVLALGWVAFGARSDASGPGAESALMGVAGSAHRDPLRYAVDIPSTPTCAWRTHDSSVLRASPEPTAQIVGQVPAGATVGLDDILGARSVIESAGTIVLRSDVTIQASRLGLKNDSGTWGAGTAMALPYRSGESFEYANGDGEMAYLLIGADYIYEFYAAPYLSSFELRSAPVTSYWIEVQLAGSHPGWLNATASSFTVGCVDSS